jgi:hypothetical protein
MAVGGGEGRKNGRTHEREWTCEARKGLKRKKGRRNEIGS